MENNLKLSEEVKFNIITYLKAVHVSFRKYFPKINSEENYISSPFEQTYNLSISDEEALIEISPDFSLCSEFKHANLTKF